MQEEIMHELEKTKIYLGIMTEKVTESVQIGNNLAMKSLKDEAKKRDLIEYYYKLLYIHITPTYSHTQTQMDNRESKKNEEEVEVENRANNPKNA